MLSSYWRNKSVLITGASSGLGLALVEALAPYGIQFCLLSRREDKMKELAVKLKDSGSKFWIRRCDVRLRDEVTSMVNSFYQEAGKLDVAWINSGVAGNTAFQNWDWEVVESIIDTNLKGAIYTIHACLQIMVKQRSGVIAGIGSAASMRGLPNRGIYSATKIGLTYFLESMSIELPEIQFTIIHPGFVDTAITRGNPNTFWMVSPEKAAQLMIKAVAKKKRFYIYPFRMMLLYRLIHGLPSSTYYWLVRKLMNITRMG